MKQIKRKIGNKNLRIILYFILGLILLTIAIPGFLEIFIWRNQVYSAISNSDWSSFLGSYLGGVIGGTATLIAVWLTAFESKTSRYKESLIEIINICSSYINGIDAMRTMAEEVSGLTYDISELEEDIDKIERNLSSLRAPSEDVEKNLKMKLTEKKSNLTEKKHRYKEVLESYNSFGSQIKHTALVLEIYLHDIDFAKDLLANIQSLDDAVRVIQNELTSDVTELDGLDLGRLSTEEASKNAKKFANQYRETYIFS